jgi:hypothetical protein
VRGLADGGPGRHAGRIGEGAQGAVGRPVVVPPWGRVAYAEGARPPARVEDGAERGDAVGDPRRRGRCRGRREQRVEGGVQGREVGGTEEDGHAGTVIRTPANRGEV